MVFVLDEGSVFKAPLDRIWQFFASMEDHQHPSMKNIRVEQLSGSAFLLYWDADIPGELSTNKAKLTLFPPVGFSMEILEGPFAGSKEFEYYIPKGDETGITSVGEWKSSIMNDEQTREAVMSFLETVFEEDQANLARIQQVAAAVVH